MARTGRFGRLPGPGYDYSSIVGSLLAQYENARNANILSAWREGGKFEGKKVTDGRLLAWFKMRRDEYDKGDPEWDEWNQQITQFRYDIAEQKMMLQYARQNIGEGAVSRWYMKSAGQFPRNSQAWRDAMINAARYRKAAQEKAAAARRAAAANAPSRTELYNREMREVTRTHIDPANRAVEWYGEVLKGAGITGGGSWDTANIEALAGGHQQVRDWLRSDDPWAARLRRQYEQRFGEEFSFSHFMKVINRGAIGSDKQVSIARKYKYYTAIPQLQQNKSAYKRYVRRARTVRNDKWSDYLQAQSDAEEALREAQTPEERERIRQELASELAPMRQFFQRRGEADAAYIIGETIDAATGGEVSATADLGDAPWGQDGADPRTGMRIDPATGQAVSIPPNSFNTSLMVGTETDRAHIVGLHDGTYMRLRDPETGSIVTVPRESYPDISSTHYLDNVLSIVPGITIDGKQYPARSDAVYVEWQPGALSVSDPDDPYQSYDYKPDGYNEFAVAETIDGELVYRYNKPDGSVYTGPIPPFDERIEVFGFSNGKVKLSGQQVRTVDPTFFVKTEVNESGASVTARAQSTLGMGAGSRSQVFTSNQQQVDEQGNPVTEAPPVTEPPVRDEKQIAMLREKLAGREDALKAELADKEAELARVEGKREDIQSVGRGFIIGSISDAIADVEYGQVYELRDQVESLRARVEGLRTGTNLEQEAARLDVEQAQALVAAIESDPDRRFAPGQGSKANPEQSQELVDALAARDAAVTRAEAQGLTVDENNRIIVNNNYSITLVPFPIAKEVSVRDNEVTADIQRVLVDKPPVYSPVLTQSDNPLAGVVASESQWSKLRTMSPNDARIVFDTLVVSNGWEEDAAAKARLAHSIEAAFMAGEAGDTHLEWMRNYPGSSMQEAIEMSQRVAFFRQRRQEFDDSGIDFWDGIDQKDLLSERRSIAARTGLSEDAIDQQYPWLKSARPVEEALGPVAPKPVLFDAEWQPQTADLDTGRTPAPAKTARHITVGDLLLQHPDALAADAATPQAVAAPPGDFDFQPPEVDAPAQTDYRAARPSWVVPPQPYLAVPTPAAAGVTIPTPTPVAPTPVAAAPTAQSAVPVTRASAPQGRTDRLGGR